MYLRVADFRRKLFVAVVEMRAQAAPLQRIGHVPRIVENLLAHRANLRLHRRQPRGERAGIMFNENAEEALDRA